MARSTHRVEVVPVRLEAHPNADSLSVVRVYGYTCVVRTADWADGRLGAYLPPDSVVPATPQFAFLGERRRIKVRRFRGVVSQGLLVPAPEGAKAGDDVAGLLGVTHYEPPEPMQIGGEAETPPVGMRPAYDVESWHRYGTLLEAGEPVIVTEKIHGTSARYAFVDGRMRCGSRSEWKVFDERNVWWQALRDNPGIEKLCRARQDLTLYGEVFGRVQELRYGAGPNDRLFAAFDLWDGTHWRPWVEVVAAANEHGVPLVPVLYEGPYDAAKVKALAEGKSAWPGADHLREGCCVRPVHERFDPEVGRVHLKIVGDGYLES